MASAPSAPTAPSDRRCAFCGHDDLNEVIDFGEVALAGAFLKQSDFQQERKYPLRVCFCPKCHAVQVTDKVDPAIMFANYFYFSSAIRTLREHFVDYATEVVARFLDQPQLSTVVEIGCNDGVLLKPLADQGVRHAGRRRPRDQHRQGDRRPPRPDRQRLLRRQSRRPDPAAVRKSRPGRRQQRVRPHSRHQRRHRARSTRS